MHQRYELLAGLTVALFACGVPCMFWCCLFAHRHNLRHEAIQHLRFLVADYTPQCWYWEVAECGKKLVLVGMTLFVAEQGSLAQVMGSMAFVVAYTLVCIWLKPYKCRTDYHLALLANFALVVEMLMALLINIFALLEQTRILHKTSFK